MSRVLDAESANRWLLENNHEPLSNGCLEAHEL